MEGNLAEREGFEPPDPVPRVNGFQDRRNRPLCHLSGVKITTFFDSANFLFCAVKQGYCGS